jgi:hypothetical protein
MHLRGGGKIFLAAYFVVFGTSSLRIESRGKLPILKPQVQQETTMRHRLYYSLPDMDSVRRTFDDLLLNRIEQKYIRFMSGDEALPNDMPEAGFLLKTDLVHGAMAGMVAGAILGLAFGMLLVGFYEMPQVAVLFTTVIGILFGGWASSMAAAAMPNSQLKAFYPELASGRILMIADVPARRVGEIEKMLAARHPETRFGGEETHVPVFP